MTGMTEESVIGPLSGVKVVDLATNIAGPLAARMLAEMGADAIHVEPPWGDDGRNSTTPFLGREGTSRRDSAFDLQPQQARRRHRHQASGRTGGVAADPQRDRRLHRGYDPGNARRSGSGLRGTAEAQPATDSGVGEWLGREGPAGGRARLRRRRRGLQRFGPPAAEGRRRARATRRSRPSRSSTRDHRRSVRPAQA